MKPEAEKTIIDMVAIRRVYDTGKVKVEALKGIDLSVEAGEFVAIVGPSGSGKSTLMNLIGCLDTPSDGTYRLGGEDVSKFTRDELADVRNRRVGFVFQGFNLLPQITAFENVEMPLRIGRVSLAEGRPRAQALLERVGLAHRLSHRPGTLSGGEQQRVAIARALVMRPALLLADEPTGNLDEHTAASLHSLLREMHAEQQLTSVIATHNSRLADACDRVLRLEDGHLRPA